MRNFFLRDREILDGLFLRRSVELDEIPLAFHYEESMGMHTELVFLT